MRISKLFVSRNKIYGVSAWKKGLKEGQFCAGAFNGWTLS